MDKQFDDNLPGYICFDKLFKLLDKRNICTSDLRYGPYPIQGKTISKMRHGGGCSLKTIIILCGILECQPGDIMEYKNN